ncbi:family 10 glycosylhydrolase [Pedobacter frigoris]|uniref:Glycosyl hydrolase-like 10 domain-containing protein n=1 Tax=Pedobacter frigoris TaxID=2571272 RepID=A0A4U1CQ47_9SPHI|nr:family 10 glycosylhydrolase [Pedobacter frigoris]TKC09674.1 hypothetical protein FA047_06220 [Pedobacter frigoris]
MKKYFLLVSIFISLTSCSKNKPDPEYIEQEIPLDIDRASIAAKPIQMWIDAHANFSLFADKANITAYMEKMKATGFTEVYVDVKPGIGYALYNSDILPKLTKWGNVTVNRDWDYLAFWIQEAERLNMSVIASLSVMGYGYTKTKEGLVYDSQTWNGKTQLGMLDASKPTVLTDIRNDLTADGAMLNPCLPEVQTFVTSVIAEVATKYPKLKGIALDYCRWWSANYGFGDATIAAFKAYSGKTVNSNNDIITATGGIGPIYKDWIEFRSMAVTNLITNIRTKVKSINPKLELHLWASADWASRYGVGQNWASKNYKPTPSAIYTDTYSKTGFADQLDVFSLGAYTDNIFISENPGSVWSVENFVTTYDKFTKGDCKVYGSFASYAYGTTASKVSDAVYLSLKNTEGVMAFEISHVINNNQWGAIKAGIDRVYKK